MGLLDKLWDDTLAGPRPESGLSRLRKHNTFAFRSAYAKDEAVDGGSARSYGGEEPKVTRSIMIKRPSGCPSPGGGTPPSPSSLPPSPSSLPPSPAGSSPPVSPFSGGKEWNRFRRKSSSDAYDRGGGMVDIRPSPPPPPHEV